MDFIRVGDKVLSLEKIYDSISEILLLRSKGLSQQDVASRLGIDRTFISRLEALGEVQRGGAIALIGFPVANPGELEAVAREEGVEFTLLFNDEERWRFVRERSGAELLNELLQIISRVRTFPKVILIGSDKRLEIMKGLLDRGTDVKTIVIGQSPMKGDVRIDPGYLRNIIRNMKAGGEFGEKGCVGQSGILEEKQEGRA